LEFHGARLRSAVARERKAQDREDRHWRIARPDLFGLVSVAPRIPSKTWLADRETNREGLKKRTGRTEFYLRIRSLHQEQLSGCALSILDANGGLETAVLWSC